MINSNIRAYVAMWFNPSMAEIFDKCIEPGVNSAGYKALRIDRKEHNNKIDDEIIAEIRRSRFLIADLHVRRSHSAESNTRCREEVCITRLDSHMD